MVHSKIRGNKDAFTLIELLVVIAIIAILAAILFPVFASVRAKARETTCLSNLNQVSLGALQYQQDSDGTSVPWQHGWPDYTAWPILLQPYIKNTSVCFDPQRAVPSVPIDAAGQWGWNTSIAINMTSYASGWWSMDRTILPDRIPSPSTRAAFTVNGDVVNGENNSLHWFDPQRSACPDITDYKSKQGLNWEYNHVYQAVHDYHRGMMPVVYVDGHAKSVAIAQYIGIDTTYGACEQEYFANDQPNTTKAGKLQEFWGRWWEHGTF